MQPEWHKFGTVKTGKVLGTFEWSGFGGRAGLARIQSALASGLQVLCNQVGGDSRVDDGRRVCM